MNTPQKWRPISDYGFAFEHFVILEIMRLASYRKPDWRFSYLTTKDNAEIDLIIERPGAKTVAIEIKSTKAVDSLQSTKLNSLINLTKDLKNTETFIFSQDPIAKKIEHVNCLLWSDAFARLGLDN